MNDKIKEILEKHLPYMNECLPDEALIALNNAIIEICEEQIEEALIGVCHSDIIIKPQNIAKQPPIN